MQDFVRSSLVPEGNPNCLLDIAKDETLGLLIEDAIYHHLYKRQVSGGGTASGLSYRFVDVYSALRQAVGDRGWATLVAAWVGMLHDQDSHWMGLVESASVMLDQMPPAERGVWAAHFQRLHTDHGISMTRCDGAAAEAFSHVISSGPQGPLDTTWPAAVPSYVNICVSMHPKSEYASMQGPPHNAPGPS